MVSKKLTNLLKDKKQVYLDTSIFIYYFQNHPQYADFCEQIFDFIENNNVMILLSPLVLTELLVDPYRKKEITISQDWVNYFKSSPQIKFMELTPEVALFAAYLRANYNLKTPDSLHLATAIENKCELFITNDLKLKRVQEIKVVCLGDYR